MSLISFENQQQVSLLKDPFKQDCIHQVYIIMDTNMFSPYDKYWWAKVSFVNGNTKGEQKFGNYKPDEFDKMIAEIKSFTDSLNK